MVWQFQPSPATFVCNIPSLDVEFHIQEYSNGINFAYFVKEQNVLAIPHGISFQCERQVISQDRHLPNVIPLHVMSDYSLLVNNEVVLELRRPQRHVVVR